MGSKLFGRLKLPNFGAVLGQILTQNVIFNRISSKIDGFENPSLKIDWFRRTHRTHADGVPASVSIVFDGTFFEGLLSLYLSAFERVQDLQLKFAA